MFLVFVQLVPPPPWEGAGQEPRGRAMSVPVTGSLMSPAYYGGSLEESDEEQEEDEEDEEDEATAQLRT